MDLEGARGGMAPAPARRTGSSEALACELAEHGLEFRVEARGGFAILTCGDARGLDAIDPPLRRWLVGAAQRAGFTHVAVEIPDDSTTVPLETLPGPRSP